MQHETMPSSAQTAKCRRHMEFQQMHWKGLTSSNEGKGKKAENSEKSRTGLGYNICMYSLIFSEIVFTAHATHFKATTLFLHKALISSCSCQRQWPEIPESEN
uniref:Uncharacterized protein n=1 Tax=Onchocerca volvulus TaxID=6282 RepID=A0A8R1TVK7_ONCVO